MRRNQNRLVGIFRALSSYIVGKVKFIKEADARAISSSLVGLVCLKMFEIVLESECCSSFHSNFAFLTLLSRLGLGRKL